MKKEPDLDDIRRAYPSFGPLLRGSAFRLHNWEGKADESPIMKQE
jgi:hypothetical protein